MPAEIVLGLTALGIVAGYAWVVWKLSWFMAECIARPFAKPDDDETVRYVGTGNPDYGMSFVAITRGDRRVQLIGSILVLPPVLYVHYEFWEPLGDALAWLFEDVLGPFIVETFYAAASCVPSGPFA
jgi:hypothetical protein